MPNRTPLKGGTPWKGGKPDKFIRDALILELFRDGVDEDGKSSKTLRLLARRLIQTALEGDVQAIKEIADRVDGKPPVTVQGDADNPLVIQTVVREIVHVDRTQRINPMPNVALSNAGNPRAA
jgi:hypothetical protein